MGEKIAAALTNAVVAPGAAKPKPFRMPNVNLGDIVLWRHQRDSAEPCPAVVTRLGANAIAVSLMPPDTRSLNPKDGIRHRDDPANIGSLSDSGVWEHTATTKLLLALQAAHDADSA